jgi:AGZA family xanthine/uracil permease-like MFS transporter
MTKPSFRTEVVAGVTTFFTMAYIIFVNPQILASPGTGLPFSGVMTATVLLSFAMTLLMGLYAKLPFAVAPGMGINAFFAFTIILRDHVPWQAALGIIFWAGVLFCVISFTPLRVAIASAIPRGLRTAAAGGIGVFLTFIGLKNGGFIAADPVTFVRMGQLGKESALSLLGFIIMVILLRKKNPFAFLAGMGVVTALALCFGIVRLPDQLFSSPDFGSVFFKLDPLGALKWGFVPAMVSILFTDLFDSISTFIGVSVASKLLDKNGQPLRLKEGLIVDALATLTAGLFGSSSGTAYIESSAGIEVGGRTGLTSVVTALCFLPFLFVAPIAAMVPSCATGPVLILVGALMFRSVTELSAGKLEDLVPEFLTVVLIPLTFSITQGILWGFVAHVVLYAFSGRAREIKPMMWGIGALSGALLVLR